MRLKNTLLITGFVGLFCCALTTAVHTPSISSTTYHAPNQLMIWTRSPNSEFRMDLASGAVSVVRSPKSQAEWKADFVHRSQSPDLALVSHFDCRASYELFSLRSLSTRIMAARSLQVA